MELNRDLILASASPRRKELLEALGFTFTIRPTDADEIIPEGLAHEESAEYLAILKAEAARKWLKPKQVILTADSVVVLQGEWLGKPENKSHAVEILHKLCGNTHDVYTGICIQYLDEQGEIQRQHQTVNTRVSLLSATAEEIKHYVNRQPPLDRAGSYGIQDWIGWAKVNRIEGSYSNVMGLPTAEVYAALKTFAK